MTYIWLRWPESNRYGHTVDSENDYYILLANKAVDAAGIVTCPPGYLVDLIPARKFTYLYRVNSRIHLLLVRHIPTWMPGAGFKRQAQKWRESVDAMWNIPFDMAKSNFVKSLSPRFGLYLSSFHAGKGVLQWLFCLRVPGGATRLSIADGWDDKECRSKCLPSWYVVNILLPPTMFRFIDLATGGDTVRSEIVSVRNRVLTYFRLWRCWLPSSTQWSRLLRRRR